jgi:hypothetical protein
MAIEESYLRSIGIYCHECDGGDELWQAGESRWICTECDLGKPEAERISKWQ